MRILTLNETTLSKYFISFVNCKEYPLSYGWWWTEQWADKPLFDNKSFKEHLIWKGYSLWYFYEYFIRDTYTYKGLPFLPFSGALFKIDLYEWIIKEEKPNKIIIENIDDTDLPIIEHLSKREGITLEIKKVKKGKVNWKVNKLIISNLIKSRIIFRYLLSKFHKKEYSKTDVLIVTNDRHALDKSQDDAFFGPIIKELNKQKLKPKVIEYDRLYSLDNLEKISKKYFIKHPNRNFVGDYYSPRLIYKIFKTAKEFAKKGRKIINHYKFKSSLEYKGINIYPLVKKRLEYTFDVLSYYIADVLIITKRILERESPKVILLEHEKNFYDKGMIVNANYFQKNNKIVCFEGELIYDKNNYLKCTKTKEMNNRNSSLWRPLPDLKLLWGSYSKEWFIKNAHYPKNILKVIGAPKYDYLVNEFKYLNKKAILKKHGLEDKKTILVVCWGYQDEELIPIILNSIKNIDAQIIIKLHPDNDYTINKIIDNYHKKLKIRKPLVVKYANFYELLAISDLVLAPQSTLVYDILAAKKKVIVLNFSEYDEFLPYMINRVVPLVTKPEDLSPLIQQMLKNEHQLKIKDKFAYHYMHLQDGCASKRAVQEIKKLLRKVNKHGSITNKNR